HHGMTSASAAAIAAYTNATMNTSVTAAAPAKAIPRPSAVTLRFSSSAASSSSSRTIALVRSATSLTAAPTRWESGSGVGRPSPLDPPREDDPSHQRRADDDEGGRAASALLLPLPSLSELRSGR